MTDLHLPKLKEAISTAAEKIRRFQDRNLGEQNTKASLVEPVLEALGWDVRDPDEVYREFKPRSRDSPVDYALTILRKPRLFVEAKGLGETLSDRKWIAQVLGYATVAGVEWCVLTDGDEYRFYNATAPLDAEEKLFCKIKLSDDAENDAAKTLTLISRANMEENLLDVLWSAHFVDRRVRQALQDMFSTTAKGLVRLIRQREPKLSPKEIVESLRRLDIRIGSATPLPEPVKLVRKQIVHTKVPGSDRRGGERKDRNRARKVYFGVRLSELIEAGFLSPPIKLFCPYKGTLLEATLQRDGSVEFQGQSYSSCSTAAEFARSTVTGHIMHTNGWIFWQYLDNGKKKTLSDAREKYLAAKPNT